MDVPPSASGRTHATATPPAVVAEDRARIKAASARREWRRSAPALLLAVAIHAGAIWLYVTLLPSPPAPEPRLVVVASTEFLDLEDEPEAPPEDPRLEPPEPVPEPVATEVIEVLEPDDIPASDVDLLGLGATGLGGAGLRARVGVSGSPDSAGAPLVAGSAGFRGFVADLRQRGLDVVFAVDATGSMQTFIDRARATIDDIIADLSAVVPNLRVGLVAYRDLADEWVTRHTDLTDDRYRIHNFLLDLDAAGGKRKTPDFEEAVEEGLRVSIDTLDWRPEARRVIVLVADAPYHEEDEQAALSRVRGFARGDHALVNTIYVGNDPMDRPTEYQQRAREVLGRIARAGRGLAFELLSDDEVAGTVLRSQVIDATFGPRWRDEVAALLALAPRDNRLASVRRHAEREDRPWLLRRLKHLPLHPAVPEACIQLFDGSIGAACLALYQDEGEPAGLRSAALYILKKSLPSGSEVSLDVSLPVSEQARELAVLRHELEQVPRAGPAPVEGANVQPPGPVGGSVAPPPLGGGVRPPPP